MVSVLAGIIAALGIAVFLGVVLGGAYFLCRAVYDIVGWLRNH